MWPSVNLYYTQILPGCFLLGMIYQQKLLKSPCFVFMFHGVSHISKISKPDLLFVYTSNEASFAERESGAKAVKRPITAGGVRTHRVPRKPFVSQPSHCLRTFSTLLCRYNNASFICQVLEVVDADMD